VKLLRNAGVTVDERTVTTADLDDCDEMFTTAMPARCSRSAATKAATAARPIGGQAHELYMAFARTQRVI